MQPSPDFINDYILYTCSNMQQLLKKKKGELLFTIRSTIFCCIIFARLKLFFENDCRIIFSFTFVTIIFHWHNICSISLFPTFIGMARVHLQTNIVMLLQYTYISLLLLIIWYISWTYIIVIFFYNIVILIQ